MIHQVYESVIRVFSEAYQKQGANSDDVFPILVYILLTANPEGLLLSLSYLYSFLRESLMQGRFGFLLANFQAAVSFLDHLDGHALFRGTLRMKDY